MASEAISEHLISKISWGSMAPDPSSLVCFGPMQIRRPCNPPSKNPGYGPDLYAFVLGGRLMGAQIGVPSGPGPGHIYHGSADGSRGKLIPVSRVPINITSISKYRIQDDFFYLRGISLPYGEQC